MKRNKIEKIKDRLVFKIKSIWNKIVSIFTPKKQ